MVKNGEPVLRMRAITKRFPGVLANDHIDFELKAGEVHGLLGENGAGKTTLMKILYGHLQPDSGEILIRGEKVEIAGPKEANELGIGMVHQHFMLVQNLTALENVVLGIPLERPPLLDLGPARAKFEQLTKEYELELDPNMPVWQLPVGDQQWLEILKLLFRDANILILDEPTAVLAPQQAEQLFRLIRRFAQEGRSIIFISHKLKEIKAVADRITVLRDGQVIGTVDAADAQPSQLAEMMVGRTVFLERRSRPPRESEQAVLEIEDLNCLNDRGLPALKDLNLTIRAGEIVGVAGVDGNGQRELAECISGLRKPTAGSIRICGQPIQDVVRDTSLLGFVPEDRHRTGLVLGFTVAENMVLKNFADPPFTRRGIIRWDEVHRHASKLMQEYDVRAPDPMVLVSSLSGGNQQRVVVARELSGKPSMLVTSQPTRGLDVGSVESVHSVLLRERNRGAGVLFISTELSEVMALSDRIIVMYKGEIMGELEAEGADVNTIGELMLGHREVLESQVGGAQ